MSRIAIPTRETALPETHQMLDAVKGMMGVIPNVIRLLAVSPVALGALLGFQTANGKALDVRTRDAIALAVSAANGCNYCKAAHSFVTNNFNKTPPEEIALNLEGKSSDPKRAAAALFTKRIAETRGKVSDAELKAVRDAGYTDKEIVEMVSVMAQVSFTNYLNNLADTDIDIPAVKAAA